ncbi:MAG: hypothetical protein H8D67_16375 [Deltaproteobacteria bacterium]|nr:hypothetical protein [Deltaproteobacteria bacterium]
MSWEPIIIHYGCAELHVVPAIHFSHVFASAVHRCCYDPNRRPNAIAVELGPQAAAHAHQWLKEITVDNKSLPVMLGLLKQNRIIRSSYKEKALRWQQETKMDLSEMPPELLQQEFGYCGYSLLCLSPSDSIIEAIRCSVEFNMPVYGIDLEDMAGGIYKRVQIQAPQTADLLATYINQNAHFAEQQRDEEIDHRREIVMAARLKALLHRYRRVVFICGMAHWLQIKKHLNDNAIAPAYLPESVGMDEGRLRRVVVHPVLAIECLDLFPALAFQYEKKRLILRADTKNDRRKFNLNAAALFSRQLQKACKQYFVKNLPHTPSADRSGDLEMLCYFKEYLQNLALFSCRPVPDIFMTIQSARETMSADFVKILTDSLMKFPWASLDEFPDCALVSPSLEVGNKTGMEVTLQVTDRYNKKRFFLQPSSSTTHGSPSYAPLEWDYDMEANEKETVNDRLHTWGPYDRLITVLSARAIEYAAKKGIGRKTAPFEGSLCKGIDVKHTLRSFSRGVEQYYVKDLAKVTPQPPNILERFPVVWILRTKADDDAEWKMLFEPSRYMEKHIRDKLVYQQIVTKYGREMVSIVAYGKAIEENPAAIDAGLRCDHYSGITIFQPICWTNKQFARWAEMTGYARTPFCSGIGELHALYRQRYHINIKALHWTTALILLAVPFAEEFLTVVIPAEYEIDKVVFAAATRYGVQVRFVPLQRFLQADLDRLSRCHMVPALSVEPICTYAKEIERYIGEKQTDYLDLVPKVLTDFGSAV